MHNVGQALSGRRLGPGFAPEPLRHPSPCLITQRLRAGFPGDRYLSLHENGGAVLNEKLINHQLDMAVIYEHSPVAGVSSQALLKEDLFLVGTQIARGKALMLMLLRK